MIQNYTVSYLETLLSECLQIDDIFFEHHKKEYNGQPTGKNEHISINCI